MIGATRHYEIDIDKVDHMSKQLTEEEKSQIYDDIKEFLSEELDVPADQITPQSKIIDDLNGDSMIYLELVEMFKKRFDVNVEVRLIGQYFQRHPIYTVGETAQAVYDIVERGDNLLADEDKASV
ncbi:acyl carrier protein [Thiococcus pfennigii]|jgi:acyl carrier protein|uniref:acyl carrier protein n=2 Tax=Thiococcus pfennigii TaxID=1057 RepID=UPI0019041A38|nr:phosphopantetheine-binding protein [Thiococcus pfennigii]